MRATRRRCASWRMKDGVGKRESAVNGCGGARAAALSAPCGAARCGDADARRARPAGLGSPCVAAAAVGGDTRRRRREGARERACVRRAPETLGSGKGAAACVRAQAAHLPRRRRPAAAARRCPPGAAPGGAEQAAVREAVRTRRTQTRTAHKRGAAFGAMLLPEAAPPRGHARHRRHDCPHCSRCAPPAPAPTLGRQHPGRARGAPPESAGRATGAPCSSAAHAAATLARRPAGRRRRARPSTRPPARRRLRPGRLSLPPSAPAARRAPPRRRAAALRPAAPPPRRAASPRRARRAPCRRDERAQNSCSFYLRAEPIDSSSCLRRALPARAARHARHAAAGAAAGRLRRPPRRAAA
jgi:hypothetical protein